MLSAMQVIYVSALVPRILIPIVLVGQVFLIYYFHSPGFQTASQLAVKGRSIWGHKMAGPGYMSDMGAVEPNKSPLAERLDPVLVPDLETAQATRQGSTLHGYEPNTHSGLLPVTAHESTVNKSLTHMSKVLGASQYADSEVKREYKTGHNCSESLHMRASVLWWGPNCWAVCTL